METFERDASVEAHCKINEQKHTFCPPSVTSRKTPARLLFSRFPRQDGGGDLLVETKAQGQSTHPNVLRKRKAAVAWCDRINALPPEKRSGTTWHYVLLGQDAFYGWRDKGGSIAELLAFAKLLRPVEDRAQGKFVF